MEKFQKVYGFCINVITEFALIQIIYSLEIELTT